MFVYPRHPSSSYGPFARHSAFISPEEQYYQALAEEHARQAALAREKERQQALRRAMLQRQLEEEAERDAYLRSPFHRGSPRFSAGRRPQSMYDLYNDAPSVMFAEQQERARRLEQARLKAEEQERRREAAERARLMDALFGFPIAHHEPARETPSSPRSSEIEVQTANEPVSSPAPSSPSESQQTEQRRHEAASLIQSTWRDYVPRSRSRSKLATLESKFQTLKSEFTFPSALDFAPTSTASTPTLLYTSTNAPVHAYEHALTSLLTELDAVESHGDKKLREQRKSVVKTIEKELEELDKRKVQAWTNLQKKKSEVESIPVDVPAEAQPEKAVVDSTKEDNQPAAASMEVQVDSTENSSNTVVERSEESLPLKPLPEPSEIHVDPSPSANIDTLLDTAPNDSDQVLESPTPSAADDTASADPTPLPSEASPSTSDVSPIQQIPIDPTTTSTPSDAMDLVTAPELEPETIIPPEQIFDNPEPTSIEMDDTPPLSDPDTDSEASRSPSWPATIPLPASESLDDWTDDQEMAMEIHEAENDLEINDADRDKDKDDEFVLL